MPMHDAEAEWVLTDWYGSYYGDHVYPKIAIHTPEQLRAELEAFARMEPRLLNLESADGFAVRLALGGALGVVHFSSPRGLLSRIAVALPPTATEMMCFVGDWQPSHYLPRHLLPAEQVIEIALELYETQQPPAWVKWER